MYENILFPVDIMDKSSWRSSLPVVIDLARKFGSTVHILFVVPDFGVGVVAQYFSKEDEVKMMEKVDKSLEDFVAEHLPEDIDVNYAVTQGGIYERIIDAGHQVAADVIVMTAHRPELKDYLLGPNAAKVVRHSDISVLVLREHEREKG